MPADLSTPEIDGHRFIPYRRVRQARMRYHRLCYNDVPKGAVRIAIRLRNDGEHSFIVPMSTVDQEDGTALAFVVGETEGRGRPVVVRFTTVGDNGLMTADERELLDIATVQ